MLNASAIYNFNLFDASEGFMTFITHIFVFFGYGLFTLYLVYTGEITRFISPKLVWLTYFSGFSLGLFLLALSLSDEHNKAASHGLLCKKTAKGMLLIYPIILFSMVRPSDISAVNTPAVREIPVQRAVVKKQEIAYLPVDSEGYVRLNLFELWLLARNHPETAVRYKFRTAGMVSGITQRHITLSRLFMTCCAADVTPVEVDILKTKNQFNKGDWVEVSGMIIIKDYVIIIPDDISLAQRPSEVYITRWSEKPPFNP